MYDYALQSKDESGLKSPLSPIVSLKTYDDGLRKQISSFTANFDKDKNVNRLSWTYNEPGDYFYIIYRSENGGNPMMYQQEKKSSSKFEDKLIFNKTTYRYYIQAVYKDGGKSEKLEAKW